MPTPEVKRGISVLIVVMKTSHLLTPMTVKNKFARETALGYFEVRLSPWKSVDKMKDSTLAVFRAEEHTAQISAKSDEDAYTQTELYELMLRYSNSIF